ncbi:MAG: D-aminoacyl-tRNA deacylase [Candidatus Ranarchaeia archaeon]|jgi:D-aminoacyl-tRNA deacylase
MVVLISSTEDQASTTIREILINDMAFQPTEREFDNHPIYEKDGVLLATTDTPLIHTDHLEKSLPTDLYVFLSRHKSTSDTPGLLTHTTGNWGTASDFGGSPKNIAVAPPQALRISFLSLQKYQREFGLHDFMVTLEATHHGPTEMNTPLLFVEIGSTPTEWKNLDAAKAVALTALDIAQSSPSDEITSCIGIGGPHYCPNFNKLLLRQSYALGHIIPRYALTDFDLDMIPMALSRSHPKVDQVILDWKGIPGNIRQDIVKYLSEHTIQSHRVRNLIHG